ncbi:MAG: NAD-dependent epimerase/dehydratase family protein [Pyrinomonadaceae bacterium]
MKISVIGCNGFVGRRLVARLVQAGHELHAVSSSTPGGIDAHSGLLHESFSIPCGSEAVVYLAASPHYYDFPGRAAHAFAVNVLSAVKVAEHATRSGVKRLIYASTGSVYAPSFAPFVESSPVRRDNLYCISKVHAEESLALYAEHMEVLIIRPFGIYGPGQRGRLIARIVASVLEGKPVTIEKNPADPRDFNGLRVSLCYVDDVVSIIESVITRGGSQVLNVAGPQAPSVREIATIVGRLVGREPVFQVLDSFRDTDLIADITLLNTLVGPQFTDVEAGLAATVEQLSATLNV